MRKSVGVLLAAAGAALAVLIKNRLNPLPPQVREIELVPKNGRCEVTKRPERVELRWLSEDQVHWVISNPDDDGRGCDRDVTVCLKDWDYRGLPIPPVKDLEHGRFCRKVRRGQRNVRIPAKVSPLALPGVYTYEIYIDGELAIDPMVEVVP